MRSGKHSPIGVFDSGVGGLTVLKALNERLPMESTVYLGDTARVPYGTKSAEVVTKYSLNCAQVLLDHGIKLLVVACNTASAFALKELREKLPIPVVGVIEPAAVVAAKKSQTGKIAVIGTPGTVASGAYQRALTAERQDLMVGARACPLFVPLAEEGWVEGTVPELVAKEYLGDLPQSGADVLVLGCTHYPLLKPVIAKVVGPDIQLVDSAMPTVDRVVEVLSERELLKTGLSTVERHFFVTDVPEPFVKVSARFLGRAINGARQIDLKFG